MNDIAIIPARSGSKGLKDKNIRLLGDKPLIAYTIEAALNSNMFDCIHVSTDSEKYAQIAVQYGAEVEFLRSKETSSDTASTNDVIQFVIGTYREGNREFERFTVLQPTSPLRTGKHIIEAFQLYEERDAKSVVSVCETDHSPLLCNRLNDDRSLYGFLPAGNVKRRQDVEKYYRINGAIYLSDVETYFEKKTFYHERSYAYIMDRVQSVDIDTEMDFEYAAFLMKNNLSDDATAEVDKCL